MFTLHTFVVHFTVGHIVFTFNHDSPSILTIFCVQYTSINVAALNNFINDKSIEDFVIYTFNNPKSSTYLTDESNKIDKNT